jgi:hypothetical protein
VGPSPGRPALISRTTSLASKPDEQLKIVGARPRMSSAPVWPAPRTVLRSVATTGLALALVEPPGPDATGL